LKVEGVRGKAQSAQLKVGGKKKIEQSETKLRNSTRLSSSQAAVRFSVALRDSIFYISDLAIIPNFQTFEPRTYKP
jgi:hypothetical protein